MYGKYPVMPFLDVVVKVDVFATRNRPLHSEGGLNCVMSGWVGLVVVASVVVAVMGAGVSADMVLQCRFNGIMTMIHLEMKRKQNLGDLIYIQIVYDFRASFRSNASRIGSSDRRHWASNFYQIRKSSWNLILRL